MGSELIRNCKFKFQCDQSWNDMETTDNSGIRHCGTCNEDVHLCKTPGDLRLALVNNWCVALYETETEHPTLIGEVEPTYFIDQQ